MPTQPPPQYDHVSLVCKANVYFDGKVVSHTIRFGDGTRKTVGLIYPGEYNFKTGEPERMDIIAGACRYRPAGQKDWKDCPAGAGFRVPGQSSFDIAVDKGILEYVCSFG